MTTDPASAARPKPGDASAGLRLGRIAMERLDALGRITETPGLITRRYLTTAHAAAAQQVQAWMQAAGMRTRLDAVGNVIGRYDGADAEAPAFLLGSHIDTVVNAGRYDGTLGVVAAIGAVEEMRRTGQQLRHAIEVVAFGDEEGVRFPTRLLTSRALTGAIAARDFDARDGAGVSVRQALDVIGGDADAYATCVRAPHEIAAYLELHIEQGPVLEQNGLPLGAVTAISGGMRLKVAVTGVAGHAGTVPMALRRDALAAAAEMVLAAEKIAASEPDVVATVGRIEAQPGAPNVVPGGAEFTVDLRSPSDARRLMAHKALCDAIGEIAARRGVQADVSTYYEMPATGLDARLIETACEAIAALGHAPLRLPSGAGHDAMAIAERWPAGMIFLRCKDGISHNPAESITTEDADAAVRVLIEALRRLDGRFT